MPTANLIVDGAGTSEWTKIGGLTIPSTMNSDDGDTSYYNNDGETGLNDVQCFTFTDMPGTAESITGHVASFKAAKRSGNDKTVRPAAFLGDFGTGADKVLTVVGSYVLFTRSNMQTATPSIAQMNAGELRLQHTVGNTGDVGWTYVKWDVTYLAAGGSCFKTEIGFWLPPLIGLGANLMYREIWAVLKGIQEKYDRSGNRVMPMLPSCKEEFEAIKKALAIRPRFCFLGR